MRGFLLISHGLYAKELKNSLKMMTGDVSNVHVACLLPEDGQEEFRLKLKALEKDLKQYEEVYVFADLLGGTPCNVATTYFIANENVSIIAGMNFPQLLTALLADNSTVEELVENGKESIVDVKGKMLTSQFDEDE